MKNPIFGGLVLVALPLLTFMPGCGGGGTANVSGGIATPTPVQTATPTAGTPTPTPTPDVSLTPIFTDAFLTDNDGKPAEDFGEFLLWNVTNGTVDLVGGTVSGSNDDTDGRYVDLDGGNAGKFATKETFDFAVGTTYNLSFTYKSTDGKVNSATARFGDTIFKVTTKSTVMQKFSKDFTFNSATQAALAFEDLGNDGKGIGIDNIVLSRRL